MKNNKKRSKPKRLLLFLLGLFLSFGIIVIQFVSFKPIISNDLNDFTSENYINFRGGKLASRFLPTYEELSDYETIDFHYFNGTLMISLYKHGVTFTLDVKYNDNIYLEKKNEVINKYSFNNPKYCTVGWNCYPISEQNNDFTDYSNNFAVIYTNDDTNIIRYVYYYNTEYNDGRFIDYSFDNEHVKW